MFASLLCSVKVMPSFVVDTEVTDLS